MNTKSIFRTYCWLLLSLFVITGCDEEDKVYLSTPEAGTLTATTNNIVLDYDESEEPVLSFAWDNNNTLYFSDSDEPQKDLETVYFQISTTEDFSDNVITSKESGLSKAYNNFELNLLTQNLNIPPFEPTDIYFRTRYTTGSNIDGVVSNVVTVNVTGYYIDMTIATLLNKAQTEVVGSLYSRNEDGIYTGFVYATSWMNFYMVEGNGKIWGNRSDSPAFILDANNYTDCWYPKPAGCYYTEMETKINEWACIYIPVLTVSGDISTDLEFEGESLKWTAPYTASSAGTLKIKIETTNAKFYNANTGDGSKNEPLDTSYTIGIDGSEDIELSVPAAGNYTLELDLSDPTNWTCTLLQ